MRIELDRKELKDLLIDAMELGAKKALVEAGVLKPYLSKAEAYKKYSRKLVDRWLRERLIIPIKDGTDTAKVRLDRMELESVAKTSNRLSWYEHYK